MAEFHLVDSDSGFWLSMLYMSIFALKKRKKQNHQDAGKANNKNGPNLRKVDNDVTKVEGADKEKSKNYGEKTKTRLNDWTGWREEHRQDKETGAGLEKRRQTDNSKREKHKLMHNRERKQTETGETHYWSKRAGRQTMTGGETKHEKTYRLVWVSLNSTTHTHTQKKFQLQSKALRLLSKCSNQVYPTYTGLYENKFFSKNTSTLLV